MLIKSVELENVKSYAFAKIALGPGVTAILGENGAGKSTILEAVGFALFDHRNGKLEDLLREGAKSGRVAVTLSSSRDGADYVVEREFTAKTTTRYRVHQPERDNQIVAEGVADVQQWLRSHMGVPPDAHLATLFENTIGVPQGTFTAPFLLAPAQRKAVFDPLLRVEEYRKASDNLRPTVRQLKDEKVALDTEIARMEGVLTVLAGLREERSILDYDLARLGTVQAVRKQQADKAEAKLKVLAHAAKVVEQAREKAEAARVALTQQATLAARIEAVRANQQQADQEVKGAQAQLRKTKAGIEKAGPLEADIGTLQQRIDQSRERVATAKEATASFRTEWKGIKRQSDFLDSETGACPTCGSELTAEHCDALGLRNAAEMSLLCAQAETQKQIASDYEEAIGKLRAKQDTLLIKLRELPSQANLRRAREDLDRRIRRRNSIVLPEPVESHPVLWERQIAEYEQAKACYDREEHTKVQVEATRVQQELAGITAQLKEKHYRLTVVKDSIEALEATEKELAAKTAKATETSSLLATIETVRDILREAGPYVTRRLVRQISQGAATMFADLMGDSGRRLQWSEDYEVLLDGRGYSRTFAQLSGGEQMVAALAVRLALLRETSAIDVAFFDEPTAHLDPERRESLADSLSQVKGLSQLFVISHDSTFESAAENTVRIVKDGRGSRQEEAADANEA